MDKSEVITKVGLPIVTGLGGLWSLVKGAAWLERRQLKQVIYNELVSIYGHLKKADGNHILYTNNERWMRGRLPKLIRTEAFEEARKQPLVFNRIPESNRFAEIYAVIESLKEHLSEPNLQLAACVMEEIVGRIEKSLADMELDREAFSKAQTQSTIK